MKTIKVKAIYSYFTASTGERHNVRYIEELDFCGLQEMVDFIAAEKDEVSKSTGVLRQEVEFEVLA